MLRCPHCNSRRGSNVIDSGREPSDVSWILRRRECNTCHQRYNTREYADTKDQWRLNDIKKMKRKLKTMQNTISDAIRIMDKKRS